MEKKEELIQVYDREVRRRTEWTRMSREEFPNLVRYTADEKKRGASVSWFLLNETNADAEIERQIAHYRSLQMDLNWQVFSHDAPADMGERLLNHGFSLRDTSSLMVLDLDAAPAYYWSMPTPDILRVTTPEQIDAIIQMEIEIWEQDLTQLGEGLKMDLRDQPDLLSMFAVFEGKRAMSAAWMYYLKPTPFAMLLGGSTRPEVRRRGYYTTLLAMRAREARERGVRYLTVDAGPMSRPILEKHAFLWIDESGEYELKFNPPGK